MTRYKEELYYVPGSIPMLFINVHKKGLDNPQVRRALAYAINYPQIAAAAMSRYSAPANASLIIPEGSDKPFFDAELVKKTGWEYNPENAVEMLEQELGAKKGDDGVYVLPDSTPCPRRPMLWWLIRWNACTQQNKTIQPISA